MNHDDFAWCVAENTNKERPSFIRFAEIKADFKRVDYPHRLNVFWTLRTPTGRNLPSEQDYEETGVFEERLVKSIEAGGHSVLIMILTGRGKKEYVIQTADPSLFLQALTNMPQEEARYPIEIIHHEDPSWDYFDRVLSDVENGETEQTG